MIRGFFKLMFDLIMVVATGGIWLIYMAKR